MDKKLFLGALWRQVPVRIDGTTTIPGQLGIVAKKSDNSESWKAYIGVTMNPRTENEDIDIIIQNGSPLTEEEAIKWFPDIKFPYRS